MANRFFPNKEPRPGLPFSFVGFARGIRKIANALARMEIVGGHIEWNAFDEPKIIVDPAASNVLLQSADFPHDILSAGTTQYWYRSEITTSTPGATPAGYLTKTSAGKLKLSAFQSATKLDVVYGESGSSISKVSLGSGSVYTFPYAFLTRDDSGAWKWITVTAPTGMAVDGVLCKSDGKLAYATVVEFACPSGGSDTGAGTSGIEV